MPPFAVPVPPAISLKHLTKEYPVPFRRLRVTAVSDLSLEVSSGQVYGLLGPNGSGKSTAMKMVLGLVPPTSGSVEVFGRSAERREGRAEIGFLPEGPYFHRWLTGEETLRFYGRLGGLRGEALRARARELLHRVGLEDAADRRLGGYSKGMLQRIGLAQALMNDPRLLVLDEPTAGVDPSGSRAIKDLILDCKGRGITVLLCSHLLAQVQEVCDRIGILDRGELVREGPVGELLGVPGTRGAHFRGRAAKPGRRVRRMAAAPSSRRPARLGAHRHAWTGRILPRGDGRRRVAGGSGWLDPHAVGRVINGRKADQHSARWWHRQFSPHVVGADRQLASAAIHEHG